jgi:hypothetical protein
LKPAAPSAAGAAGAAGPPNTGTPGAAPATAGDASRSDPATGGPRRLAGTLQQAAILTRSPSDTGSSLPASRTGADPDKD